MSKRSNFEVPSGRQAKRPHPFGAFNPCMVPRLAHPRPTIGLLFSEKISLTFGWKIKILGIKFLSKRSNIQNLVLGWYRQEVSRILARILWESVVVLCWPACELSLALALLHIQTGIACTNSTHRVASGNACATATPWVRSIARLHTPQERVWLATWKYPPCAWA